MHNASVPELRVQRGEAQVITLDEARSLLPDVASAFIDFVVSEE
jgi:hypothetical protein